jgi:alpha-beta hydrolase superfamily lysophospholipase
MSTYALDHRGHGRSDGRRGHVRRFVRYVQDLEKFRRRVVGSVGPDVPLVFLGHSLGGLVLIRYLEEYPGVPALLYYAVPALPMSTGLPSEYLSHDALVVEAYERDFLVHDRVTPRTYGEIHREIDVAFSKASQLRLPMLFLVPSDDRIVRPDMMQRFAASLSGSGYAQLETYAGLYHEVLNEANRSRVVVDVLGWIERQIAVYSPSQESAEPPV